jgi:hypothetical protein
MVVAQSTAELAILQSTAGLPDPLSSTISLRPIAAFPILAPQRDPSQVMDQAM